MHQLLKPTGRVEIKDEREREREIGHKLKNESPSVGSAMEEVQLRTAPADFRFPTTNQTRHCFTRYIEFHRCIAAKGEESAECEKFARYYRSLCPGEWVDKWNEQRDTGTFPGPL